MSNDKALYVIVLVSMAIALYWYLYTAFIERLRSIHPTVYESLDRPNQMDSNLSQSNRKLWGFILYLQFRSLRDVRLSLLGFGLLSIWILIITVILVNAT